MNEPHPDIVSLTDAFRRVARERMQGLPMVNAALEVEAVDFREWDGRWRGVLIAPWFMNRVLLPAQGENEPAPAPEAKQILKLPSGEYEFTAARLDPVGSYQSCVLFSSVLEFPDQRTAREVAQAVHASPVRGSAGVSTGQAEPARVSAGPPPPCPKWRLNGRASLRDLSHQMSSSHPEGGGLTTKAQRHKGHKERRELSRRDRRERRGN